MSTDKANAELRGERQFPPGSVPPGPSPDEVARREALWGTRYSWTDSLTFGGRAFQYAEEIIITVGDYEATKDLNGKSFLDESPQDQKAKYGRVRISETAPPAREVEADVTADGRPITRNRTIAMYAGSEAD